MGGGSTRSASEQNTATETTNSNLTDNNGLALSAINDSNVDISVVDGNAIQNMFQVTMAALEGQQMAAENALGLNESSLKFAASVKDPSGDNVKKLGVYFAVATVLVVVVAIAAPKLGN